MHMIPSSYPFFKKPEEMDQNIISEGTFIRIFAYITVNYSPNLLKTIALLLLRPEYAFKSYPFLLFIEKKDQQAKIRNNDLPLRHKKPCICNEVQGLVSN